MQGIELHLGFKLHSKESGSRWARTSNIEIDLGMGGLKLGVKSLSISGELVVRLEPLLQEMPVIGGVVVCCLIRPRLEMEFSGLAMHMDRLGRTSHSHTAMGSASAKRRAMACFHRDGSPTFRERGNPSRLPHRSSAGASPSLSASPPVSAESPGRPKRRLASGWGWGGTLPAPCIETTLPLVANTVPVVLQDGPHPPTCAEKVPRSAPAGLVACDASRGDSIPRRGSPSSNICRGGGSFGR